MQRCVGLRRSEFQGILPFPAPAQCAGTPGGGVSYGPGAFALNDADLVVEPISNIFCGAGFPTADPALIGEPETIRFSRLAAPPRIPQSINNLGDVVGYSTTESVIWDDSGVHGLGPSAYRQLNNVGQVIYTVNSGFAMWQNGVSTPIQLPTGFVGASATGPINDAGQFIGIDGGGVPYLSDPFGCLRSGRFFPSANNPQRFRV